MCLYDHSVMPTPHAYVKSHMCRLYKKLVQQVNFIRSFLAKQPIKDDCRWNLLGRNNSLEKT